MTEEAPRRSSSNCSSEFEFWMVGNPSTELPLLTADKLIVNGVLLPLHQLQSPVSETNDQLEPDSLPAAPTPQSRSRRWKESFGSQSELINLHIWPFSRTKSTVNNKSGTPTTNGCKASSVPCSQSNSPGEPSKKPGGAKILNLNVNTCIGYRNEVSCSDKNKDGIARDESNGGSKESLSKLKTIFSKKVL